MNKPFFVLFAQKFQVTAVDNITRKEVVLTLEARSKNVIEKKLEGKYSVRDIKLIKSDAEKKVEELLAKPLSEEDILKMLNFLANSLQRGVRFKKALEFLMESEEKKAMKQLLEKMHERLEQQFSSYYDIFKSFPEYFNHSFLGIVRAGESTGNLAENILQYIAERRKMLEQKKFLHSVFIKRGVLFSVVILISIVIITFVIPQFTKLFSEEQAPGILLFLDSIADFFSVYGALLFLIIIGSVGSIIALIKYSYDFKKRFDKAIISLPLIGDIVRTYYTCQYLYFTGTLLMKNVHYLRIMDILIEQTPSIPFKDVFRIMKENITKGVPLHEMLKRSEDNLQTHYTKIPSGYLLPSLSQALDMGSATGNMGQILYDAFLSYEIILYEKTQRAINIFDKVFYTFIILLMGSLFFAMGSAMAALYKNAGSLV